LEGLGGATAANCNGTGARGCPRPGRRRWSTPLRTPGRCRNEAALANLAGVAPIPASSGQTTRYRLNRCGDRQLNRALHVIALTRPRHDPATRAFAERRRGEGKTDREIKRCLKRYIARQLYRQLEAGQPPT
jgi:transposase